MLETVGSGRCRQDLPAGTRNHQSPQRRVGGLDLNESQAHFGAWAVVSSPLTLGHDLTDDEAQILSLDSTFSQRLQNAMKPQIDQQNATQLGLTVNQYYEYAADVHNGMDTQKAYQKQILPAAEKAGYLNPQNYIDDVASGTQVLTSSE